MTEYPDSREVYLWNRLVEAEQAFVQARMDLFAESKAIVDLLREALRKPTERASALGITKLLSTEQKQALFPDLLSLASVGAGHTKASRDLILSLPRSWVLSKIERSAEPILNQAGYEEYQRLLELYSELDRTLTVKLAHQAANELDPEVREVGRDFLEKYEIHPKS